MKNMRIINSWNQRVDYRFSGTKVVQRKVKLKGKDSKLQSLRMSKFGMPLLNTVSMVNSTAFYT